MSDERIAIIVDSCTDVVADEIRRHHMYVLPLHVNFSDGSYRDGVDISPEEVYARMVDEIPTTSLPSPQEIEKVFRQVVADGYTHAIAVTISSGLSGTYETVRMIASRIEGLECEVIDTKNIGLGAGFTAIAAGDLIQQKLPFAAFRQRLLAIARNTKVFYSVATLKYLKLGGRIGELTYLMGSLLDMTPIISCNEKGVYYAVKKVRGKKTALNKMVKLAQQFASGFKRYNVAVFHGCARERAQEVLVHIGELFPEASRVFEGQISPALGVHTGPGLVGVCIQGLSD
jgi:DegV family protein with EDD domain